MLPMKSHFQVISRDSQSGLEGQIESSRVSDERDIENHRTDLVPMLHSFFSVVANGNVG